MYQIILKILEFALWYDFAKESMASGGARARGAGRRGPRAASARTRRCSSPRHNPLGTDPQNRWFLNNYLAAQSGKLLENLDTLQM